MDTPFDTLLRLSADNNKSILNPDTYLQDKHLELQCLLCNKKTKPRIRDFLYQCERQNSSCTCNKGGKVRSEKTKIEKVPKPPKEKKEFIIPDDIFDLERFYDDGVFKIGKNHFDELREKDSEKLAYGINNILEKYFSDYPIMPLITDKDIESDMMRIANDKTSVIDNAVESNNDGRKIPNKFMYDVMIRGHKDKKQSYYDLYFDKTERFKIIQRSVKLDKNFNNGCLYRAFACAKGTPYNFPVNVAKAIYNKYGNGGRVLDFCAGFGGRLTGFFFSDCKEYVGIDPNTANPYDKLIKLLNGEGKKEISIYNECAEDFNYEDKGLFDLCFTSPPYFKTEIYSKEETQSCHRYGQIDSWLENFLYKTLGKVCNALKPDGTLAINIKDCGKIKIVEPMIEWLSCIGWKLTDSILLKQSKRYKNNTKVEYIYIFKNLNSFN